MIKIYTAESDSLAPVFQRTQLNVSDVTKSVREILKNVRENGDTALVGYARSLDGLEVDTTSGITVSEEEFAAAYKAVPTGLLASLRRAKDNVLRYHKRQVATLQRASKKAFAKDAGWVLRPVERAGVYVPGGTAAYPSSVLMCVLPAVAAGVREVCMSSPNPKNPLTLVAARECGVKEVLKCGGAHAIGAMAYGTESVKKVSVIAGPGNIYVMTAKAEVYGEVSIDMLAGPSEILIISDGTGAPAWTAADMLSQAEHDKLSASILITTDATFAARVADELEVQAKRLPRADIATAALSKNGAVIVVKTLAEAVELSNKLAPEHLELAVEDPRALLPLVKNAGAVFMGHYSPEPLGDYYAGPSHCLPTSGTAKYFSALSADTFLKKMSVISYSKKRFESAAADVMALAEAEGFDAHKNAVSIRINGDGDKK